MLDDMRYSKLILGLLQGKCHAREAYLAAAANVDRNDLRGEPTLDHGQALGELGADGGGNAAAASAADNINQSRAWRRPCSQAVHYGGMHRSV